MAWKLKKTKTDEAPEGAAPADASGLPVASVASQTTVQADDDFFASKMNAADDAIAALHAAKEPAAVGSATSKSASNGSGSSEDEEWSLDAFAPYKPADKLEIGAAAPASSFDVPIRNVEEPETELDTFSPVAEEETDELSEFEMPPIEAEREPIDFDAEPGAESEPTLVASEWDLSEITAPLSTSGHGLTEFGDEFKPAEEDELLEGADGIELEPIVLHSEPLTSDAAHALSNGNGVHAPVEAEFIEEEEAPAEPIALGHVEEPIEPVVEEDRTLATAEFMPPPAGIVKPEPLPATPPPMPATPVATSVPRLVVRLGAFTANYDLGTGDMIIGRLDPNSGYEPEVAVEWDDAISRRHAHVFPQGSEYYIEDMESTNGTKLNGQDLPPHTPVMLHNGDRIRVGEHTEITFEHP